MDVWIDWGDRVIVVPRDEMTLIQPAPEEIRELNINDFRLALKSLEDDVEGIVFTDTHQHNPEVAVGGTTVARVVKILDPYMVEFEDGQYAVNMVGANSNIPDVAIVNQVSLRSFNTGGLVVQAPALTVGQFLAFK